MYTVLRNTLYKRIADLRESRQTRLNNNKIRPMRIALTSIHVDNSGKSVEELNLLFREMEINSGVIFDTAFNGVYDSARTYDETCVHLRNADAWINMIRDDGFSIGNYRSLCNRLQRADIVVTTVGMGKGGSRDKVSIAGVEISKIELVRFIFGLRMATMTVIHQLGCPAEPLIQIVGNAGVVSVIDGYLVVSEYKPIHAATLDKMLV